MAIISGLMTGFVHPKTPFQIQKYDRSRDYNGIRLESKMIPSAKIQYFLGGGFHTRYATSPGRNHHELSSGNDFLEEPFWLTLIKEAFWALKSLFVFLLEQPSQLKYIEWPSFQSTDVLGVIRHIFCLTGQIIENVWPIPCVALTALDHLPAV